MGQPATAVDHVVLTSLYDDDSLKRLAGESLRGFDAMADEPVIGESANITVTSTCDSKKGKLTLRSYTQGSYPLITYALSDFSAGLEVPIVATFWCFIHALAWPSI